MPLAVAGGNCSITGFSQFGDEKFWTVSGDQVKAMEFLDFDQDGQQEMIAGSDDYSIRVFKGEEMIYDISEKGKIA